MSTSSAFDVNSMRDAIHEHVEGADRHWLSLDSMKHSIQELFTSSVPEPQDSEMRDVEDDHESTSKPCMPLVLDEVSTDISSKHYQKLTFTSPGATGRANE
jgi:hypothetical protein